MSGFCVCDFDPPVLYRAEVRRARKAWTCEECGGPIQPGDTYEVATGLNDGWWWRYRTCQPCLDGPRGFVEKNCGCFEHGGIREHLTDVFREYPFEHPGVKFRLGRMLVEMRRRRSSSRSKVAA